MSFHLTPFPWIFLFFCLWPSSCLAAEEWTRISRGAINGDDMGVNIEWLTDAQLSELSELEMTARMDKLRQYFDAMEEGDSKKVASEKIVADCYGWLPEVASEEEREQLKHLHHTDHEKCKARVHELVSRLAEEKRDQVKAKLPFCEHVWYSSGHGHGRKAAEKGAIEGAKEHGHHGGHQHDHHHQQQQNEQEQHHEHAKRWAHRHPRDHHHQQGEHGHHGQHSVTDYLRTHLGWLNNQQKEELKTLREQGKGRAELQQKVMDWFDQTEGETRTRAQEQMRAGCWELLKMAVGEEKAGKVKLMHQSGAEQSKVRAEVEKWVAELADEHKKALVAQYKPMCGRVFEAKATGRRRRAEGMNDEQFGQMLRTHLSWLSDQQKEELKGLKAEGKGRTELHQKVMGWFGQLQGEAKEKAREMLQGACRQLLREIVGDEKADKLKQMRESGTSPEEMGKTVDKLLEEVEDEGKKSKARDFGPTCKKLFGVTSRRRRNHHSEAHHGGHILEECLKTHLSWLSDQQKEELKGLKAEGKNKKELHQKVMDWFDQTEGEAKEKAREMMKGGCREMLREVFGEEKAKEVQQMKETGTSPKEIAAKISEWIEGLEEGHKKEMALEYAPSCRKIFGVEGTNSRKRRSRHGQRQRQHRNWREEDEQEQQQTETEGEEVRLDDEPVREGREGEEEEGRHQDEHHLEGENLHRHNSWLSRKQKKLLKGMRDRGHAEHDLHDQIHQFYQVSPEEVKATARGILQRGCEGILKRIFGDYKAEEIIEMYGEGASNAEIDAKIDESLGQIRNPSKREEAGRFAMTCRRIFAMIERRRRAVAPAEHSLEELFKSYLSWLSDQQKEELKGLRDEGKGRTELQQKVMDWFGQLQGEAKEKARERMHDGCRELLVALLGRQNADELKRMKESGVTEAELVAKANELIGGLEDEGKKAKATEFGPTCKAIFLAGNRGTQ